MILALTSDTMPVGRIYDAADSILAQKLSQVEGVGQVFVGGGAKPAVRVQVDPGQLSALGYGLEDVRAGLRNVNANSPKGELSGATSRVDDQRHRPALRGRAVPAGDRGLPARARRSASATWPTSPLPWKTSARAGSPTASARWCSSSSGSPGPT